MKIRKILLYSFFNLLIVGGCSKKNTFQPVNLNNGSINALEDRGSVSKTTAPEGLNVGNAAPEFTLTDIDENLVTLADFRGQYVLIEFWASWCLPCKLEAPNLVSVYNRRKSSFTILGVSLDKNKTAWKNVCLGRSKEWPAMPWIHVADLRKGFKSTVAIQYNMHAIPDNFLLDPTGKIIAINLRGSGLSNKLTELELLQ